jgi:hypothetical protein
MNASYCLGQRASRLKQTKPVSHLAFEMQFWSLQHGTRSVLAVQIQGHIGH